MKLICMKKHHPSSLPIDSLMIEDNLLVSRIINGEGDAFCALYAKYWKKLHLFIIRFLKSGDLADDICQDVFTIIWTNRKFLDAEASFQTYLYTIARNRVLNFIRDNTRMQALDELILAEAIDHGDDTLECITANELEEMLAQAIEKLTGRQREIFQMSRDQGLSHREIAQTLGLSASTVNEHITNALKVIQNHLSKHYNIYTVFLILSQLNR